MDFNQGQNLGRNPVEISGRANIGPHLARTDVPTLMKQHILPSVLACCALLAFTACTSTKPSPANPQSAGSQISASDTSMCEAQVKRLLADPAANVNESLLRSIYAPRLFSLVQRWIGVEPGTGPWITGADHITETNDPGGLQILSVGPAKVSGSRVIVPVVMGWPGQTPYRKAWIFESVNGKWMAVDMIDKEGESLLETLVAAS